jgi:hypothetical protein
LVFAIYRPETFVPPVPRLKAKTLVSVTAAEPVTDPRYRRH